jgi:hypothetical protein
MTTEVGTSGTEDGIHDARKQKAISLNFFSSRVLTYKLSTAVILTVMLQIGALCSVTGFWRGYQAVR